MPPEAVGPSGPWLEVDSSDPAGYLLASLISWPASLTFSPTSCAASLVVSTALSVACFALSAAESIPSLTSCLMSDIRGSRFMGPGCGEGEEPGNEPDLMHSSCQG